MTHTKTPAQGKLFFSSRTRIQVLKMREYMHLGPVVLSTFVAFAGAVSLPAVAIESGPKRDAGVASPGNPPQPADNLTPERQENGRDIYRIAFDGGEPAVVALAGDGSSNLALFVYDADGNLLCRSAKSGDRQTCEWKPAHTADFFVEVRNAGGRPNRYRLWTN
jgi:hypothetical protein